MLILPNLPSKVLYQFSLSPTVYKNAYFSTTLSTECCHIFYFYQTDVRGHISFKILFIYLLYLEANYFTILWWFLPYIDISQPWVYMCPPVLNHPLTAPSPSFHSLGYPSAAALSAQFHALKLDWSSISHMVIYIFQCYSLKPSHPRHLPQNEKSVLYMCVSFAVKNIGSSLPFF